MGKKHYPQERADYPPAHGWLTLTNNREKSLYLQIAPSGVGCQMLPGETYHVHIMGDTKYLPNIAVNEFILVVQSADAIYHKGREVCDFTPMPKRVTV